jgi:single-strand DNA-binding protein
MVNKCIFIGRVGQTPEIKTLQNTKLASFSLAVSEKYKDKSGEKVEKTTWINASVFGNLADVVEKWVEKGQLIYIEGKLQIDEYEKDGIKRQSTKIIVNQLTMLGGGDKAEKPESKPQQQERNTDMGPEDDMLPF